MSEGLLSLQWNNHKFTLHQMLSSIRKKKSYTDTTLACDGLLYPVHKIVLSMCSKYFEEIFVQTQGQHPVIILKDIKRHELECLLNYMYIGEVNVPQEKLAGLIKAAECLQIKGLAVPDEEPLPTSKSNKGGGGEKRGREESQTSEAKKRRQDVASERNVRKSRSSSPIQSTAPQNVQSKELNENSAVQSSKSKSNFKNQPKNLESFCTTEKSETATDKRDESSSQVQELLSLKKEAEEDGEAEENFMEAGPGGVAVKEEPVYLSDSNSNGECFSSLSDSNSNGECFSSLSDSNSNDECFSSLSDSNSNGECFSYLSDSNSNDECFSSLSDSNSNDEQHQHMLLSAETVGHDGSQMHFMEQLLGNEATTESLADDVNCVRESSSSDAQLCSTMKKRSSNPLPSTSSLNENNLLSDSLETSRRCTSSSDATWTFPAVESGFQVQNGQKSSSSSTSNMQQYSLPLQHLNFLNNGDDSVSFTSAMESVHALSNFNDALVIKQQSGPSLKPRTIQCPQCSYNTWRTSDMKKHIRIHTGEKPFACSQCSYRSSNPSNIRAHEISVHASVSSLPLS
ncbi:BTB/POZ domain [Trinorchestia longiramus]|nr:BTB/POZ domain [Trinorchestia longiramus]